MDEPKNEEQLDRLPQSYRRFSKEHNRVWEAYRALGQVIAEEGPLDLKTRELVKLGMAAGTKSYSGVQSHTHRALGAGAAPREVEHALMLGITTLGFPTMMAALSWAREAIEDHEGHGRGASPGP